MSITKEWQALIDAMLAECDKSSDADMDMFNHCARMVNDGASWFDTWLFIRKSR